MPRAATARSSAAGGVRISSGARTARAKAAARTVASRRQRARRLATGLAAPLPFRKVLEPAPELPLRARLAALRHCCPKASDAVLRRAAKDRGCALLAALRCLTPAGGAPAGSRVAGVAAGPSKTATNRRSLPPQVTQEQQLGAMLEEAARAEAEQTGFLSEQERFRPKVCSRPRQSCAPWPRSLSQGILTCCACREEGPQASMVLCGYATGRLNFARRTARAWAKAFSASGPRVRKSLTPNSKESLADRVHEALKDIEPHVFCPSCLRTYLMGTTVHAGSLRKMFCPGCTKVLRDNAEVATGGWRWCEECGEYHYGSDFDMTGLGLDGIRDELGMRDIAPFAPEALTRVLGPLDLLRLRDVAANTVHPPKLSHGIAKALRVQGARRCSFCNQAQVVDGGCNAVLCESCGLVFDWDTAKRV
uniref:Uncharacterized protein n=1 Tax=Alexandrium monilatum TaxID=311494 RepID=A0A7S4R9A4_9DINO